MYSPIYASTATEHQKALPTFKLEAGVLFLSMLEILVQIEPVSLAPVGRVLRHQIQLAPIQDTVHHLANPAPPIGRRARRSITSKHHPVVMEAAKPSPDADILISSFNLQMRKCMLWYFDLEGLDGIHPHGNRPNFAFDLQGIQGCYFSLILYRSRIILVSWCDCCSLRTIFFSDPL